MLLKIRNIVREIVLYFQWLLYVKLDKAYLEGIHIGHESYIASGAIVFSHDCTRNLYANT